MMPTNMSRGHDSYAVGIICALPVEKAAVTAMLDEEHPQLSSTADDDNDYTVGRIGRHNIVVACLPAGVTGKASAAIKATNMLRSFPITVGLMVGIGGGAPSKSADIRLGDVVVSKPTGQHGGVVQWDFGKTGRHGEFRRTGTLNKPPQVLLNAVASLQSRHELNGSSTQQILDEMVAKRPNMAEKYGYQGWENDWLFQVDYDHIDGEACDECDPTKLVSRRRRNDGATLEIHYGNIASGDQVMRDGKTRDRIATEEEVICFEMEAAGLMDSFPCIVIRGVCDYADTHKNKRWQRHAAATAAAYAKELLGVIDPQGVRELKSVGVGLLSSIDEGARQYSIPFSLEGVPAIPYDKYVGRVSELEQIGEYLCPDGTKPHRRKIFLLCGMGGIGKTQLAARFARQHQESFSAVLWLNGSSRERVEQSFVLTIRRIPREQLEIHVEDGVAGKTVDVDAVIREVHRWLSIPSNKDWLLIFDNVDREYDRETHDKEAFDVMEMMPHADHGSVLITSRLESLAGLRSSFTLGRVSDVEAQKILEQEAGSALQDADVLVSKLNGLPLALTQAGAYIKMTETRVKDYAQYYDDTWSELMEEQDRYPLQEYAEHSLLTTWKLSYLQVERKSAAAASLLKLWSMLHWDGLWFEMIAAVMRIDCSCYNMPSWILHMAKSRMRFANAVKILREYSLMDRGSDNGVYTLHPVLHKWCGSLLTAGEQAQLYRAGYSLVGATVQDKDEAYWTQDRKLVPHMLRLLQSTNEVLEDTTSQWYAWASTQMGTSLLRQTLLTEAKTMYLRALAGREKALGPNHVLTLQSASNLGSLYCLEDKLPEAEAMYLRALNKNREIALGADHISTLHTFNGLGSVYRCQGKLADAEVMFLGALAGNEHVHGADHPSTLRIVNNLGMVYCSQGKPADAETMFLRALAGCQKTLGADHTFTLDIVYNLAVVYDKQGKLAEAEPLYLRALTGLEKAVEEYHTTLKILKALGLLYFAQGKLVEAEAMFSRAITGFEKARGLCDSSILDAVGNLGAVYCNQGKVVEAEAMFSRAITGFEKARGPCHPSTLNVVNNLGRLYYNQGKLDEAEALLSRVLTGFEEARGPCHSSTLEVVGVLGRLYNNQGKLVEAEALLSRVLTGFDKARGPCHPSTLEVVGILGGLYYKQDKLVEAEAMFARALLGISMATEPCNPLCLKLDVILCRIYRRMAFQKRSGLQIGPPTYDRSAGSSLEKSPQQIMTACADICQQYGSSSSRIYGDLGCILMSLDQEEDAAIAFEQQIEFADNSEWDYAGVRCDGCEDRINMQTGRLICRSCMDIDLCRMCYQRYECDHIKIEGCQGHTFLASPRDGWKLIPRGKVSLGGETVAEWLESLKTAPLVDEPASTLTSVNMADLTLDN